MKISRIIFVGRATLPGVSVRTGSFVVRSDWESWEDANGVLIRLPNRKSDVFKYPWANIERLEYFDDEIVSVKGVKKAVE